MTKFCTKCKEEKPLTAFSKNKKRKDGLQAWCKECNKTACKSLYDSGTRKNQVKERVARQRKHLSDVVRKIKLNKGCSECGYNKNPAALEFHHVHEKYESVARLVNGAVSEETLIKEIEKCIILCANCHRQIHHPYAPVV